MDDTLETLSATTSWFQLFTGTQISSVPIHVKVTSAFMLLNSVQNLRFLALSRFPAFHCPLLETAFLICSNSPNFPASLIILIFCNALLFCSLYLKFSNSSFLSPLNYFFSSVLPIPWRRGISSFSHANSQL